MKFLRRLRALFQKDELNQQLSDELAFHVAKQTEQNLAAGMNPEEARYAALRKFGGVEQVKEECRDSWGVRFIDALLQDIRYAVRMLARNPGFTAVAVLALALGIGAATAVFSLVNAVLIRSLPYSEPERLVYVWSPNPRLQIPVQELSPGNADFAAWQGQSHSFSNLALFTLTRFNVAGESATESVGGSRVTASFFPTMGVVPELGRVIEARDDQPGHESVAVISDALWQSLFGGSRSVLASTIHLDGRSYEVVGVMPPTFVFPHASDLPEGYGLAKATDVWVPRALTAKEKTDPVGDRSGIVIGRLRSGVSAAQAQAEMSALMARLDARYPPGNGGFGAFVKPFADSALGDVRPLMWLLFGAVWMVLLICCSNVMNLQMARAEQIRHELGVRAALGARRGRLVRYMLTEALLLASAGGFAGALIAYAAVRILVNWNGVGIPRLAETSIDARVLFFTLAISTLAGVLVGVYPAVTASRSALSELLKQGGQKRLAASSSRVRRALIVVQVALSVTLLAGTGLLIRSYLRAEAVRPGYSPSTLTMNVSVEGIYKKPEQQIEFFQRVISNINELPGVLATGATNSVPLTHSEMQSVFMVAGYRNQKGQSVDLSAVTPQYFEAMGVGLLRGRYFADRDAGTLGAVAIANRAFTNRYLGEGPVLGRRVCLCEDGAAPWYTIVGEVADIRQSSVEEIPHPQIFVPLWSFGGQEAYIAVKTSGNPDSLIPSVRKALRRVDPMIAFADIRTMSQLMANATARRQFQTIVLFGFALAAVLLAMVGLYGLMTYSVAQRTAEMGIRVALGASPRHVFSMVIGEGARLIFLGMILGVGGALAMSRLLSSFLYDVKPTDPATFVTVALLLSGAALLACYIPAQRATRVDPMVALRHE